MTMISCQTAACGSSGLRMPASGLRCGAADGRLCRSGGTRVGLLRRLRTSQQQRRQKACDQPGLRVRAAGGDSQIDAAARHEWRAKTWASMNRFIGPALVIPLGDPLQSVIDTVCIGQFAGTGELAALAPALVIFAFAQYSFQALQIATITLVGDALRLEDREQAGTILATAIWVAALLGLATTGVLEAFPAQLITLTGADSSLVPLAAEYMRIRALAQPAVLVTMVCQAGLLAQQDSRSPAVSVLLALVTSLVGNLVAVAWLGLGLAGAAATTVASQLLAAAVLLHAVLGGGGGVVPRLGEPPRWAELVRLAVTCGPLSVTSLCKNLAYVCIQTTATSLEVVRLAAHQAVFSIFNLFSFASSPVEQASLAFVPRAKSAWQQGETVRLILWLGVVMGVVCGGLTAGLVAAAPQLLTRDAAVWPLLASVGPQAMLSMLLVFVDVAATSVLLAKRDLAYVARSFAITLAALAAFISFAMGGGGGGGVGLAAAPHATLLGDSLGAVWWALVFFYVVRALQSVVRLAWLSRRRPAEGEGGLVQPAGA